MHVTHAGHHTSLWHSPGLRLQRSESQKTYVASSEQQHAAVHTSSQHLEHQPRGRSLAPVVALGDTQRRDGRVLVALRAVVYREQPRAAGEQQRPGAVPQIRRLSDLHKADKAPERAGYLLA